MSISAMDDTTITNLEEEKIQSVLALSKHTIEDALPGTESQVMPVPESLSRNPLQSDHSSVPPSPGRNLDKNVKGRTNQYIDPYAAEFEATYSFPPGNFIYLLHGDKKSVMLNANCQKQIIMDYLMKIVEFPSDISMDSVDMCDTSGALVGMRFLYRQDNINILFTMRATYIPCVVTLNEDKLLAKVEPCLNGWEDAYPLSEGFKERIAKEKQELDAETKKEKGKDSKDSKDKDKDTSEGSKKKKK